MIEPERVLYYFEHVALLLDEDEHMLEGNIPEDQKEFHRKQIRKFLDTFYIFCHVGTAAMHACQHPDWEEMFLKYEQEMIDSFHMKPYHQKKEEGPLKMEWPFKHGNPQQS